MTVYDRTPDFQCVCEFTSLHCEFFREKGELLYFLKRGEAVLQGFDAAADEFAHLGVFDQFFE